MTSNGMAKPKDKGKGRNVPVSPNEFLQYVRGEATPEQTARVIAALHDQKSELNRWLREVQDWLRTAMPTRKRGGLAVEVSGPAVALDGLLQYIENKRAGGALTADEVAQIKDAGNWRDASQAPRTPAQIISAMSRMKAKIVELYPELKKELLNLRSHSRE